MKSLHMNVVVVCLGFLLALFGCGRADQEMPIPVDTTPPSINSFNPNDGSGGVPINTFVTVFFSEWVDPGTVSITLTGPGGVTVDGTLTVSGSMATFDPTTNLVAWSLYDVSLAGGFADWFGNAQPTGLNWSFTTGNSTDTIAPTIASRSPGAGATNVAISATINVTFSEDMNPATINASTFLISGVSGTVSYNVSTKTATFTPNVPLADSTTYTVSISNMEDLAGNKLAPASWSFTTEDLTAPAMTSVVPAADSTGVALNTPISITFNTPINCTTVAMTLNSTDITASAVCSGSNVTYTPVSNLSSSTTYTVEIAAGVEDPAGNPTTSPITWSFTTAGHGDLDKSLGTTGIITNPSITSRAVAIDSSGRILTVGGDASSSVLARFDKSGVPDTTFDTDGKVTVDVKDSRAIAIQSDGKILVAGTGASANQFAVVRYDTNGTIDSTFGLSGTALITLASYTAGLPTAMAIGSDAKITIVGQALSSVGESDFATVRLDSSGNPDTTFNNTGIRTDTIIGQGDDVATDVAIQSDLKTVVVGYHNIGSDLDLVLVRYSTTGAPDTGFGGGSGIVTAFGAGLDQAFATALQLDGRIVVAGASNGTASPGPDFLIARYFSSGLTPGSLDTSSFNSPLGYVKTAVGVASATAYDLVIQSDGLIDYGLIAVGDYTTASGDRDIALVRYNMDGSIDTTFGASGIVTTQIGTGDDFAHAAAIDPDGRIVVVGTSQQNGAVIMRYWP